MPVSERLRAEARGVSRIRRDEEKSVSYVVRMPALRLEELSL